MSKDKIQLHTIFIFLFSVFLLSGCESLTKGLLKDPEVTILNVDVTAISFSDISLSVKMNIRNPNVVALNLDRVTYELNVSGDNVTEGTLNEGIKIPASGQSNLTIPMKFKLTSVANALQGMLDGSFTKQYELKGHAQFGIFSIPFSKKGEVHLKR